MEAASMVATTTFSPNYSFIFQFERSFEPPPHREWMQQNWHTSFYYIGLYMVLIFGGQAYMANRPRFELRRPLACWNICLALFSIVGFWRTAPEMLHVLHKFGFYHSVCNPSYINYVKPAGFWTWMFTLSKVPELGDTVFIVFRKQKLIFLHWYHHITVLLFTWYSYTEHIALGRWYVVMNYMVHSIMYSYYALRAMKMQVPRPVAMFITTLQISQMIMGCYVSYWCYMALNRGEPCQISHKTATLALSMYLSYFILFARLFYVSYLSPPTSQKSLKAD